MFELPLFPLNTVLFPGMPLPLHIFEARYKQMIRMCHEEQKPFGVVFLRRNVNVGGPLTTPHSVGCTARIVEVQPLEEERMLIMTIGQERFRILSLNHDQPYLVGKVETAPLVEEDPDAISRAVDRLHPLVTQYLEYLSKLGEVQFKTEKLPTDPQQFVYIAAAYIQLPAEEKQPFLEADKATTILRELYTIYHREVSLMRTMPLEDQGMFSVS